MATMLQEASALDSLLKRKRKTLTTERSAAALLTSTLLTQV